MRKPKELMDFDIAWNGGTGDDRTTVVDLYKKIPAEFIDEYNNLVEVVNTLIEIGKVSNPLYENMFEEEA